MAMVILAVIILTATPNSTCAGPGLRALQALHLSAEVFIVTGGKQLGVGGFMAEVSFSGIGYIDLEIFEV